jgi:hypothetical protein
MRGFPPGYARMVVTCAIMLIVGTNPRPEEFARAIAGRPELGYQLIGFADEEWTANREFGKSGKSIVTDLDHFSDFLREHTVDEVAIALPMKSFCAQAARIVAACQEQGVIVRVPTNIFGYGQGGAKASELDEMALVTLSTSLFEGGPMVCKRLLDIIVSSFLLILLAPILLVLAMLVKFDSLGPVFVQERVGLNKRRLRIYKFRTMIGAA